MTKCTHARSLFLFAALAALLITGCSKAPEPAKDAAQERAQSQQPPTPPPPAEAPKTEAPKPEAQPPAEAPKKEAETPKPAGDIFRVRFETSKGPIVVEVHRDWAPIGAKRFEELVKDKFYDGARFFRVVPNFVVQFGLAADPAKTKKWDRRIKDDPVMQTNRVGSMVFATAGPNTRTTQLFINLKGNQFLDSDGFAPFAMVVEGMDVVQKIYPGYGERPDQGAITARGNAYLTASFPDMDYIKTARIE